MIHHHICSSHQNLSHKSRNLICKFRKNFMLQHCCTHNFMVTQILHATGTHNRIIKIYFRHISGSKLSLKDQYLRLNTIAVCIQFHILGNTGYTACLLDNNAMVPAICNFKNIVQVSISNFFTFHAFRIPVHLRNLQFCVLNSIFCSH